MPGGRFCFLFAQRQIRDDEPSAQISPPIVGRGKSGLETAPVVWARPYLCVLFQNGPRQENKHRPTRSGEWSLFWCILGVAGFLPCEQKGGKTTANVLFFLRPGRCLCVSTAWTAQLLRKGENLSKKTVTPDVLSVYRLLLGLSACRCPGELPLFFLLSNLLYSITTHCFYYGFCADDTPLFSKRCGPPPHTTTAAFQQQDVHLSGVKIFFFFFPLVLVDILVNENHPQLERKSQPCMAILNTWHSQGRATLFMRIRND